MIRRSWTPAASIEETLAVWAASLREVKKRIRPLFTQERVATNAGLFLEGLLGDERRKTGWMRAEAAGDPGPWRQQAILGRRDWDADALRDIVREYVIEHLADDDTVLVIDETGFLKQGKASCGVARQLHRFGGQDHELSDRSLRCFYVSRHGHAFIDRALYLPKEWTDDPDRLEAAYVPPDIGFATKPTLATRMIARAIAASVPFKWVAGDTVYGVWRHRTATTPCRQRVSVTFAAGTGLPCGSVTVPPTDEVPVCATASVTDIVNTTKPANSLRLIESQFINNSFRAPSWVMKTTSRDAKRAESCGNMPKRALYQRNENFPRATQPPLNRAKVDVTFRPK